MIVSPEINNSSSGESDGNQQHNVGNVRKSAPTPTSSFSLPNIFVQDESGNGEHINQKAHLKDPPDKESLSDILESGLISDSRSYKDVRISEPETLKKKNLKVFDKRVSFDTVNLDFNYTYSLDDYMDHDDPANPEPLRDSRFIAADYFSIDRSPSPSRGRGRSSSPHTRAASPYMRGSSPGLSISPSGGSNLRAIIPYLPEYPTKKIISHSACTCCRVHEDFESLYKGKLKDLKPVLPGRTILVYVSGRQHTWVALDWALRRFLMNGDSLVVVASIHPNMPVPKKPTSPMLEGRQYRNVIQSTSLRAILRKKNRPEHVPVVRDNLMSYIMEIIPDDLIIKITIELAIGPTKDVLKDMYKLYQPSLVIASSKPPSSKSGKSAPLRSWASGRLTDRLVKNFPLPVIVVPAANMTTFEVDLFKKLSKGYFEDGEDTEVTERDTPDTVSESYDTKYDSSSSDSKPIATSDDYTETSNGKSVKEQCVNGEYSLSLDSSKDTEESKDLNDNMSITSDLSIDSTSSSESYSSIKEMKRIYKNHINNLTTRLEDFKNAPIEENSFQEYIKIISDASLITCANLIDVDTSISGKGAIFARAITGSTKIGVPAFKTRSMLIDPPTEDNGVADPLLAKNTQRNSLTPKVDHTSKSQSVGSGKHSSSLKFVDSVPPNSNKKSGFSNLRKSYSHEIPADKPKLEPSKSHPDIHSTVEDKATKKNKMSKWKSMLGLAKDEKDKGRDKDKDKDKDSSRSRSTSRGRSRGAANSEPTSETNAINKRKNWFT